MFSLRIKEGAFHGPFDNEVGKPHGGANLTLPDEAVGRAAESVETSKRY